MRLLRAWHTGPDTIQFEVEEEPPAPDGTPGVVSVYWATKEEAGGIWFMSAPDRFYRAAQNDLSTNKKGALTLVEAFAIAAAAPPVVHPWELGALAKDGGEAPAGVKPAWADPQVAPDDPWPDHDCF